jgi:hypothetical protein
LLRFAPCLAPISPLFCFKLRFPVSDLFDEPAIRDTDVSLHLLERARKAQAPPDFVWHCG